MSEALDMARAIAAKSKATVAIGKEAFYAQAELPLDEAYDFASEVMVKNMMQGDAEEGICAFLEKRRREWKEILNWSHVFRSSRWVSPTSRHPGNSTRRWVSGRRPPASRSVAFFDAGGVVLSVFGREALAEDAGVAVE